MPDQNSNGAYWPELLTTDSVFDDADIYSYGYPTTTRATGLDIDELAVSMDVQLTSAKVLENHRRVGLLCHSMGLVARAFMTKFQKRLRNKVSFVYLFATPTSGAQLATLAARFGSSRHLAQMSPIR